MRGCDYPNVLGAILVEYRGAPWVRAVELRRLEGMLRHCRGASGAVRSCRRARGWLRRFSAGKRR